MGPVPALMCKAVGHAARVIALGGEVPKRRVNGIELYYEVHGSGRPLVCIHGTSSSALIWGTAVDELARHGRLIVYDRRGCTRSERPQPYITNVHEHADDAAALIEVLAAAPAIVIGRSYGGEVAVDLALRYPDRVRALVLLEAVLAGLSPDAVARVNVLRDLVLAAAAQDMSTVAETFLRRVVGDAGWEAFSPDMQRMFRANGEAIAAEFRGGYLDTSETDLAALEKPTLLVAGEESPELFQQITAKMATAIPGARLVRIKSGHFINPADPNVLAFIDQV